LEQELDGTMLHVLDEMEKLSKKDLVDFLRTHNIRLPRNRRDGLLDEILRDTRGNYELTLEALKDYANRAWDVTTLEADIKRAPVDYDYD